jgi:hypothetical protein
MLKKTRHQSIPPVNPRDRNDLIDQVRMPDRDLQNRAAAIAKTQKIRFANPKIPEQRGYIIRILLKRLRAFSVARPAMTLKLKSNDPPMGGQ